MFAPSRVSMCCSVGSEAAKSVVGEVQKCRICVDLKEISVFTFLWLVRDAEDSAISSANLRVSSGKAATRHHVNASFQEPRPPSGPIYADCHTTCFCSRDAVGRMLRSGTCVKTENMYPPSEGE